MRALPDIRGLKFPDEFVVRHAFKRGLMARTGKVLELGCGVGNNLALYRAYGWAVTGIDFDPQALDDARWNLEADATLIQADLSDGLPVVDGPFDAVIIPNLLCYLTLAQAERALSQCAAVLATGAEIFVRTRLLDDYRYGRGEQTETDGFVLDTPETGEAGAFNRFYAAEGLVDLLTRTLKLADVTQLAVRFDNIQAGQAVPNNSDLVVWGRAGA
ncbi:MAG: SAM-dependent methyltransferase [Caulobacter sp.]|nr:SAM-dependent methyltransferase [Caulobacter sp.]